MNVLIDIGHPAHVHMFKNFAMAMISMGHHVLFTYREREHVSYLIEYYGFPNQCLGKRSKTLIGKILGLFKYDARLISICWKYKPDILLSHGSMYAAFASFVMNKPHISFEDTFHLAEIVLYLPFTNVIITGDYPHPHLGPKEIEIPGYHELAYLHPSVFTPDESVLRELEVGKHDKYAIIRFVAWDASHDLWQSGFSYENKVLLIQELVKHIKVFISSEVDLPGVLEQYRIKIKPEMMHHALHYAHLFIGESGTMASECAVLGVPSIFINKKKFSCIDDQASYGLIYTFTESEDDQIRAISRAFELANRPKDDQQYCKHRNVMIESKINVSAFLCWFVESYPNSLKQIRSENYDFNLFKD